MKKLTLAALMGFAGLAGMNAHAATDITGNFNVNISLISKCEINSTPDATGALIGALALSYTSFQTDAATGITKFFVRCTDGLKYDLALDNTSVTDNVLNLPYTLALSAATGKGTGADQEITVTGTIAAGEAGTCATALCDNAAATNKQRTLTVTY